MNVQSAGGSAFEFPTDYIKDRFLEHWGLAEKFCPAFLECFKLDSEHAKIDPRRLKFAVESAYQDIARYKEYHQTDPENELLDCTKRCAYLLKWIIKFKPIQTSNVDFENESLDYAELINEAFALYLFDIHLSNEIGEDVGLSETKIRQFAYDLLYRQISVDGWIAIFQILKECCVPDNFADKVPFMDLTPVG